MNIKLNKKLKLYFLLIIVFSVVNYIIARCDAECNRELYKFDSPLDSVYFTTIVQTTNFFRYTGIDNKLSSYLKISIIIHIVLFLIITYMD
jgi:hypothetical protein